MNDFLKNNGKMIMTYLNGLTPGKAALHVVTLMSLAIILRFGFGDFEYVEGRVNEEIERYRIIKKYDALKARVLGQYSYLIDKWGGEFIVFMYFHDYYPMAIRFNALSKSYGFIVPNLRALPKNAERAAGLLTDLPVIYNDQLVALLRGECYYQPDTEDFYLSDIASILNIEEFVSFPVEDTSEDMIGYVTMAFSTDRNFTPEEQAELCLDLERVANFTGHTSEFVEIFGDIKRNGN
jgi:hypothetical protein